MIDLRKPYRWQMPRNNKPPYLRKSWDMAVSLNVKVRR